MDFFGLGTNANTNANANANANTNANTNANSNTTFVAGNKHRIKNKNKTVKNRTRSVPIDRHFKPMNCSPLVKGATPIAETCFPNKTLIRLRDAYNKHHPDDPIRGRGPREVWIGLKDKLTDCDKEDCWLSQLPENERKYLDKKVFAPDQPPEWKKNKNEWLSNYDIFDVLFQYEEKYKNFVQMGPTAIDFDAKPNGTKCVTEEICKISLRELIGKGINKVGIVFNLDKHDEPGSHWTSMFIDFKANIIFYFDSAANETPPEIVELKDRIIKQGKEVGHKFKFYQNYPYNHQNTNTECGMYSLFFIITMLTERIEPHMKPLSLKNRLELFKRKKISDKYVEKYRDVYFNKR